MSQQAHVSSEALQVLMDGLQSCASAIASLRGAVRAHINECLASARAIVSTLRAIEQKAEVEYERCSQAYYSCTSRQRYDEEKGEYRPSCSWERRDMERAKDKYFEAKRTREYAQSRLEEMEREVGYYEQPTGGEGMMNSITDEYVPEATNRLMALSDKVQRYEALEIAGIDISDSSSSVQPLEAPQSKALSFGKGTERLKEKMRQREALFGAYCPRCKCCPCECENIRELLMSRTR